MFWPYVGVSHMLLDELMPVYDVVERHGTWVRAAPEIVFAAIRSADLCGGLLTRPLLIARAVPAGLTTLVQSPHAALTHFRRRREDRRSGLGLAPFERAGFRVIGERAPEELVIGLLGQFWTPRGRLCAQVSPAHFAAGPPQGYALAGWNFTIAPREDGTSELRTETRVWCAADARTKFRAYWMVVRPGSGLIRRSMLRAIRREAERSSNVKAPR